MARCMDDEWTALVYLRLTSCQAENAEFIARAVAGYVANRLGHSHGIRGRDFLASAGAAPG